MKKVEYVPYADVHWHDKETYCDGRMNLFTGEMEGTVRQLVSSEPTEGHWLRATS